MAKVTWDIDALELRHPGERSATSSIKVCRSKIEVSALSADRRKASICKCTLAEDDIRVLNAWREFNDMKCRIVHECLVVNFANLRILAHIDNLKLITLVECRISNLWQVIDDNFLHGHIPELFTVIQFVNTAFNSLIHRNELARVDDKFIYTCIPK